MTTQIATRTPRGGNKFRFTLIVAALSLTLLATFALSQLWTSDDETASPAIESTMQNSGTTSVGSLQGRQPAPPAADLVALTDSVQYFGGYGAEWTMEDARRIASEQMKSNGITVPGGETIDPSTGPAYISIPSAEEGAASYAEYVERARVLDGSTPIDARLVEIPTFDCSLVAEPITC